MFSEFKGFLLKTNALALAIGVIIGGALGTVVTSLVEDIVMPPIGMALGRVDFKNLFVALDRQPYATLADAQKAAAATINYGVFMNTVLEFLIVAFVVFLLVRQINRLKTPEPTPATEEARDCPFCVSRIPAKATRCPHCTSDLRQSQA